MITHEGITYQLKFLEKMVEKSLFLQFFNKFARKISCNIRISSSVSSIYFHKAKLIKNLSK